MALEDEFCDIIKKARFGQGRGLGELADHSGISQSDLEELEKGRRAPTKAELHSLCQALHLRFHALLDVSLDGWLPQSQPPWTTEDDLVTTIKGDIGGYEVKGYLLSDPNTKQAVMIDTGYNAPAMLSAIQERGLTLMGVCLTHGHADHAGGLDRILEAHPVPVYLGNGDLDLLPWKPAAASLKIPTDHYMIAVGELTVEYLATPGHTPGGYCFLTSRKGQSLCFVGDTVFAGSVGRSNPASLYDTHLHSLRQTVLKLPAETVLFPGHGPATTVGEEHKHNRFA